MGSPSGREPWSGRDLSARDCYNRPSSCSSSWRGPAQGSKSRWISTRDSEGLEGFVNAIDPLERVEEPSDGASTDGAAVFTRSEACGSQYSTKTGSGFEEAVAAEIDRCFHQTFGGMERPTIKIMPFFEYDTALAKSGLEKVKINIMFPFEEKRASRTTLSSSP